MSDLTTGEFEAILKDRYPHLDHHWLKPWLDDLNETIGWLKQKFSGNARMCVPWSGGIPQPAEWTFKQASKQPKKPRTTV